MTFPGPALFSNASSRCWDFVGLLSLRGTEIITPLPVPMQRRLQETRSAVMRTNENPSFPVPKIICDFFKNYIKL